MFDSKIGWSSDTEEFLKLWEGHHIFIAMIEHKGVPWHLHDGWDSAKRVMGERNEWGWGAFWTVNELDESLDEGRHRTGEMWVRSRAIFMDDDTPRVVDGEDIGPRENSEFPLVPSVIVRTSKGKYHYYWKIRGEGRGEGSGGADKVDWEQIQNGLIEKYSGDRNARDLCRYLRLPGFRHNKRWVEGENGVGGRNESECEMVVWRGDGREYEWSEIEEVFEKVESLGTRSGLKEIKVGGVETSAVESVGGCGKSREQMVAEIAGGVNYHENLVSLSYQMKADGVPDNMIGFVLKGMMESVSAEKKDARWQSRLLDIDRIVVGAGKRLEENGSGIGVMSEADAAELSIRLSGMSGVGAGKVGEYESGNESGNESSVPRGADWEYDERGRKCVPWPPGLLGDLAGDAFKMARFRYKEVAVVSAVGLVAGIVGRKFNVGGSGLNVYLTLIMSTGMGKDSISNFVHGTLMSVQAQHADTNSFIGPSRFTGPKSLLRTLVAQRSMVCVITEAGLILQSKAGDNAGLTRAMLSLYGKSGNNMFSGSEAFSRDEDGLPMLRAPALSLISEATPETLLAVMNDSGALEKGELPRQSIFRIGGTKPYAVRDTEIQREVGDLNLQRLHDLCGKCRDFQAVENPEAWEMRWNANVTPDVEKFNRWLIDRENELRDNHHIESIMLSRAFLKAAKFAAIATVYNRGTSADRLMGRVSEDPLEIGSEEWEWGKKMVLFELEGLNMFFAGSNFGDASNDLISRIVAPAVLKIISGGFKDKKKQSDARDRKKNRFRLVSLKQALKNNREVGALGDKWGSGVQVLVDRMVQDELIRKVRDRPATYELTAEFQTVAD